MTIQEAIDKLGNYKTLAAQKCVLLSVCPDMTFEVKKLNIEELQDATGYKQKIRVDVEKKHTIVEYEPTFAKDNA